MLNRADARNRVKALAGELAVIDYADFDPVGNPLPCGPFSGEARLRLGESDANHLGAVGGSGVDREAALAAADVKHAVARSVTPGLPPLGARSVVGGIRPWAENSGGRASHLPTVRLLRRLWAPIPSVATHEPGSSTEACLISQIGRLHALRRSIVNRRAVIGRCCSILSRRPRRARPASR